MDDRGGEDGGPKFINKRSLVVSSMFKVSFLNLTVDD